MSIKADMTKKQIRKEVLARRALLTEDERKRAEVILTDRVIGHQWFYRSEILLLFASYGSEIDTFELIREGLRTGKQVYLPKITGDTMEFFRIRSLSELTDGYKGIPEPMESESFEYDELKAERTLMLVPGVAFDPFRNRIGYGKGYYDRYLADKEALQYRTIAVGFRCQQVEEIPAEPQDIKPYQVILV